jgi:hypothetical protein
MKEYIWNQIKQLLSTYNKKYSKSKQMNSKVLEPFTQSYT